MTTLRATSRNRRGWAWAMIAAGLTAVAMTATAKPHAGTAWITMPELVPGDPVSAARFSHAIEPTDEGRVVEQWTVPVPPSRFGPLVGQLIMIREPAEEATACDAVVRVGDLEGVAWSLSAADGGSDLFRIGSSVLGGSEGRGVPSIEVRIDRSADACAARYRWLWTRLWDAADPDFTGAVGADPGAGPLDAVVAAMAAGDLDAATAAVATATGSSDPAVAGAGRRVLRRIDAARAVSTAGETDDPRAAYDAALYAWATGSYDLARDGFRRAVDLAPTDPDAIYHLAEMEERAGADLDEVGALFGRAGALRGASPNEWDVLVAILMEHDREDGTPSRMTDDHIARIMHDWRVVEQMVYGASRGHYRLRTRFRVVRDTDEIPYVKNAGWLYGPTDEIIPVPGQYDSCMSFRPDGPSVTGGADCGPSGAGLVDIGTWCGWEVYLHEWNHTFDWGMISSEVGVGYPVTHDSDGCGPQPIPSMGAGHRGSMRYYVSPAMYRRVELGDPARAPAIRDWAVLGPFAVPAADEAAADGGPPRRLGAALVDDEPALTPKRDVPGQAWRTVSSPADFIDLNEALGSADRDGLIAYAHTWVYSPESRETRLWLGHNDGMRVWVNGRPIHLGRYFSIAKWEDLNRPDSIVTFARLEPGWNRILCKVQKWDGDWGFSVRPCDVDGRAWSDARFSAEIPSGDLATPAPLPPRGHFYRWSKVADDFSERLPRWTMAQLGVYAEIPDLRISGAVEGPKGRIALLPGPGYGRPAGARIADDPMLESGPFLDNVIAWPTEGIAALRFRKDGQVRDLLFVRAESMEPVLRLLGETAEAQDPVADRVLGYVMTEGGTSPRALVVFEAMLPDWPEEEEGLFRVAG